MRKRGREDRLDMAELLFQAFTLGKTSKAESDVRPTVTKFSLASRLIHVTRTLRDGVFLNISKFRDFTPIPCSLLPTVKKFLMICD